MAERIEVLEKSVGGKTGFREEFEVISMLLSESFSQNESIKRTRYIKHL